MIVGFSLFAIGYSIFYWGLHHIISPRYSLWELLGFSGIKAGTPIKLSGDVAGSTGGTTLA